MFSENYLATRCFSVLRFWDLCEDKHCNKLDWSIGMGKDNQVNTLYVCSTLQSKSEQYGYTNNWSQLITTIFSLPTIISVCAFSFVTVSIVLSARPWQ